MKNCKTTFLLNFVIWKHLAPSTYFDTTHAFNGFNGHDEISNLRSSFHFINSDTFQVLFKLSSIFKVFMHVLDLNKIEDN